MARLSCFAAAKDFRALNKVEDVLWTVNCLWLKVCAFGAGPDARRGIVGKYRRRWTSQAFSTGGGIRSILLRMRIRRFPPLAAAMTIRSTSFDRVPSGSR